jgi:hypothetical protein
MNFICWPISLILLFIWLWQLHNTVYVQTKKNDYVPKNIAIHSTEHVAMWPCQRYQGSNWPDDDRDNNDYVDEVRLHLWTAASNGPTVHPQVTYEHGEPWWNYINRGELLICQPELSGNPTSSHLVAKQEELTKEITNLALRSISFHTSKGSLTCHKILRLTVLLPLQRKACCRFL